MPLLQHLLQHLHGYSPDPVLLPAPSTGKGVQQGGMSLGRAGDIPVTGFGCPITLLGPSNWTTRTSRAMVGLGKVGSKTWRVGGHRGPQGADGAVQCIPATGGPLGLHVARNNAGL